MIKWVHQIDLGKGVTTPGIWPPRFEDFRLDELSFSGKSILDIGCCDGQYSFYAERRGAKRIVSIDIGAEQFGRQTGTNRDWTAGYRFAHAALKSKAEFRFPMSVYDLRPSSFGLFDIVLFLGVIYHLEHPALALERINAVLPIGGLMVLESEVGLRCSRFYHRLKYNRRGYNQFWAAPLWGFRAWARALSRLFAREANGTYRGDSSNRWVMTPDTLVRHIDYAGFQVQKANFFDARMCCRCRKVSTIA